MKKSYEIVGFEFVGAEDLDPHPDAMMPMDADDAVALRDSVYDRDVLVPLLVTAKKNSSGKRLILDGINRWKSAMSCRIRPEDPPVVLPCVMVETDDPRALALTCLGTGRKRSTGQRVMAFLEMHKSNVLKVAEILDGGHVNALRGKVPAGQMTGREIPKKLQDFTADMISAKLGVSDKDVRLGIELLRAEEGADGEEKQPFSKQRLALLAGGGSIRRWKAAVGGRKATAGQAKADPEYAHLALRSMVSMITVFRNWKKIDLADRQALATKWEQVLEASGEAGLR